MSQLDDIEARLKAAAPGAITITPSDVHYLLTLARRQAAALESLRMLCDLRDKDDCCGNGAISTKRVRAALEPTP